MRMSVEDIVCTTAMRLKWQKNASDRLICTLDTLRARLPQSRQHNFSANFPNFRIFWRIRKDSSESVRSKNHTAENKGFVLLISSEFVRIRPILENQDK